MHPANLEQHYLSPDYNKFIERLKHVRKSTIKNLERLLYALTTSLRKFYIHGSTFCCLLLHSLHLAVFFSPENQSVGVVQLNISLFPLSRH